MQDFGFRYFAEKDPEAIAIVDPDDRRFTRGELLAAVDAVSDGLAASGIAAGDAIAILASNCAEFLTVYLAGVQCGLYVVPVNWHLARPELEFILEDCGAAAVLADRRLGDSRLGWLRRIAGPKRLLLSTGAAPGYRSLDTLRGRGNAPPRDDPWDGRVMPYTSATTGRPKGVVLPRSNAHHALRRIVGWHESLGIECEGGHVHLCTSMLYHAAPLEGAVTALQMGHRLVLVRAWSPERLLELIERHRVTTTFMVPTMFVRLLKLPQRVRERYATRSLRLVVHSGAPCPVEVKRRMLDWWGPVIWETYGACEGQGTIASPAEWLECPGTVGRPIPGSAVKILDEAGREREPGEVGLIYFKPHTGDRFRYRGDPARTAECIRGELITVGDLGEVNERGYLFVRGRASDLILSSGMNVYPAEIEQVLVQHPRVLDCAVVGRPDSLLGAVPVAVVQPARPTDAGPALNAELLEFLARRLSPAKLPRRIEHTDRIPRDPSGKLLKRLLR